MRESSKSYAKVFLANYGSICIKVPNPPQIFSKRVEVSGL